MPTDFPRLLTQAEFDTYTADWQTLVESSDTAPLQAAFGLPDALLTYGSLTGADAVALVADSSTTSVKARFVLVPVEGSDAAFAVVIFGADADDEPTTSYYVAVPADPDSVTASASSSSASPSVANNVIPDDVAAAWMANWQESNPTNLTQELFATADGQLRGYNYEVNVFSGPLVPLEPGDEEIVELRVYCGLHPDQDINFGLLVCLGSATKEALPPRLPVAYYNDGNSVPPWR